MDQQGISVFAGSASRQLTTGICRHLGVAPGLGETLRFSEGNIFVRILENVRGREVYLVQSTAFPVNDNFVELLFWIDAFKRASAASVTVVIPYFSYAKGDKKDEPRVSIRARVCADAIQVAGADRIVTMDLHAPQIQGFFTIPVDDLRARPILCDAIRGSMDGDTVVVSPDAGFAKNAREYAYALGVPLAVAVKSRRGHDERAVVHELIGDVRGKIAVLVDDFSISAVTLVQAAERLIEHGAVRVYAAVTHAVFNNEACARIDAGPIERVFVTDTVEASARCASRKIEIVSVAPLFGEAIRRIHERQSISVLFEDDRGRKDIEDTTEE
jgi:ribose-phosphate pyrophosphokinase